MSFVNNGTSSWISRLAWITLFISIPLTSVRFGNFRLYELLLLLALILSLCVRSQSKSRNVGLLDVLCVLYAIFQFLLVFVGEGGVYESLRMFRYIALAQICSYLIVRFLPFDIEALFSSHVAIGIVVFFQSLSVLYLFSVDGVRPSGTPYEWTGTIVSYGFFAAYSATFCFFAVKLFKNVLYKIIALLVMLCTLGGVVIASSRGVIVPWFLLLIISSLIISKRSLRLLISIFMVCIVFSILLVVSITDGDSFVFSGSGIANKRSVERVLSVDDYVLDVAGRFSSWSQVFNKAMDRPILGHGMSAYFSEETSFTNFSSSAHNALIGSAMVGGVLGCVFFVMILLNSTVLYTSLRSISGLVEFNWFVKLLVVFYPTLLIVILTNDITGGRSVIWGVVLGLIQKTYIYLRCYDVDSK